MTTDKLPEWVMVPRYPALEAAECLRLTAVAGKRDCEAHGYAHDFDRSIDAAAELLAAIAAAPQREVVVDEDAQDAIASLLNRMDGWAKAYPVGVFHEPTKEERDWLHKERPGLMDCVAASMGRHMAKCMAEDLAALTAALSQPKGDDDGK